MFVTALVPNVVDSVIPGGGLDKAGRQKGDSLVAVNGERLNSWNAVVEKLDNMQADAETTGDKGVAMQLVYSRGGSVSYTHLDVYKRQSLWRRVFAMDVICHLSVCRQWRYCVCRCCYITICLRMPCSVL